MKYLYVEEDLLPVLEQVPGIGRFRGEIDQLLEGRRVNTMLHDEVFGMLDESSSLFRTLVIKTRCTIPYTSVFLQLDCAYWGAEQERALREKMKTD